MREKSKEKRIGKIVQQIDYYTGELIEEYESIQVAAEDNWISGQTLSRVLNKRGGILRQRELYFKFKSEK